MRTPKLRDMEEFCRGSNYLIFWEVMKIVTWNVNGLRAVDRKGALEEFERSGVPDILLLQEIKGNEEQFSEYLTAHPEFVQYYHSAEKKGYAGTGIWMRKESIVKCKDVEFSRDVPHLPAGDEGRVSRVQFEFGGDTYSVLSIYFPNGGKSDEAWLGKLKFYDRVLEYINDLRKSGQVVIVGGDMNVAHTEIDLARPKENKRSIGFRPEERAWMDRVLEAGWVDVWRAQNPGVEGGYTWWSAWGGARARNVGWRIDYFFIDKFLMPKVRKIQILADVMGSDHCPVKLEVEI